MKISDERRIISTMITEYCQRRHSYEGTDDMCPDCHDLLNYANERLEHCPYGDRKTACRKCVIHCYAPAYREHIREVMAYMGPRMVYLHPIMAWKHLMRDVRRK